MKILENKVAVITGGTRGLGLAIAKAYAAEGASVVIAGRSQTSLDNALKELRSITKQVAGFSCDVSNMTQVEALGQYVVETFGRVDIWVNNAGVSAPYGPTAAIPTASFIRVINTNIIGVYNGSMVALRHMLPQGSGKLINLLGRGEKKGVPLQNAYSSSKTWVRSFTLTLAEENKNSGIDIIAFNPGLVDTDMLRQVEAIQGYEKRMKPLETVMRLWANPPDVPAQKALWLASRATDGKTGLSVNILNLQYSIIGILREALRIILRKPAPDTSLNIHTVMPDN